MLAIGIVAAVVATWASLQIDWFPAEGATAANKIDTLYDWLLIASVPMFVLVMAVAIYCVVRFRARPGGPTGDGAPIHGNTRLEVIWVTIPFLIVTALAVYAAVVLADIEKKQPNELVVVATGQQFTWHFEYENAGKEVKSDVLYLPKDRPVHVKIRTADVLHSFWVPAFRLKMDAVPGQTTKVRFTPNREGSYEVVCAELCGIGHATMRVKALVVSKARFDAFVQRGGAGTTPQAGEGAGAGGAQGSEESSEAGSGVDGKAIFAGEGGCGACHKLSDAETSGAVGPDLDGFAGSLSAAQIREMIVNPEAEIAEGFQPGIMPADFEQRLGAEKVDALVQYLLEAGK
jgi:cytochrome c oxidase subunit 2